MRKVAFYTALSIILAKIKAKESETYCWSQDLFGIECCEEGTEANYFDTDGDWYKSDEYKCGIIHGNCWSRILGYPCCVDTHGSEDTTQDSHGLWAKENGYYCGIRHSLKPWNDRELVEETKEEWNSFKAKWNDEKYNFERLSVFVGDNESEINFGWYSVTKDEAEIRIGQMKDMSDAKTFVGSSATQTEYGIKNFKLLGVPYYTNRVTVSGLERNSVYYYQRKLNGQWEDAIKFKTYDDKNFKFIFVGDPQIGGSHGRLTKSNHFRRVVSKEESNRNDAFNWNRVLKSSFELTDTPSVLLSAGDQADEISNFGSNEYLDQIVNTESQYSALLYPELMKKIVTAASVGNHESTINSFGRHFHTPNSMKDCHVTKKYNGWYPGYNYFFKYNNVLVVVLETNYNNDEDYQNIMRNAILKYPETDWRVALFHHDIFGNGATHSQSDALPKRDILLKLFSSYKFDLVINGHDHVYTTSKFVSYEYKNSANYNDYKISEINKDEINRNPKGTFFVTANCATGSKYLDFVKDTPDYVYNYTQTFTPTFGVLDFSENGNKVQLSITTYEVETKNVVDGPYKFEKDLGSNKCWSEIENGYSCCPPGTPVVKSENGRDYGYYLDDYCGIVNEIDDPAEETSIVEEPIVPTTTVDPEPIITTTIAEPEPIITTTIVEPEPVITTTIAEPEPQITNVPDQCWSKPLGYDCCVDPYIQIAYSDDDGDWGYENDEWCGIIESKPTEENPMKCWSIPLGYGCCIDPNIQIAYSDDDGDWGYENDEWCGIIENGFLPVTTTTTTIPITTTIPTTTLVSTTTITRTTTRITTTTTTTTTQTAEPSNCVAAYQQCGGIGYTGSTCCSDPSFVCRPQSDYYYQCVPSQY
ncbi:Metallo-dependent phosphatase [Piromyces finnis]|uniref:Purple acid phosphatase n=1 Tax=Piromyces finnis TaxID=1754191 RepID=A0A1Y1VE46_9FUNG|nr:Metallo-dependent phosphatase [Piromyces finnis]|eukprot:ORX53034.1 Metallo-dependent phosphatase [Piromyces finnis]